MKRFVTLLGIVMFFVAIPVQAKVWYVHPDSAISRIQQGLDSCRTGDTVRVGPSTYHEHITWPNTQGINLVSAKGPDSTIIDGDSTNRVISMPSPHDTTTTVSGFTIQRGYAGTGAGVYCNNCSPVIQNNIIRNNVAINYGGGIACTGSAAVIRNNRIVDNTALVNQYALGGGIYFWTGGHRPTITGNVIERNRSNCTGAGIYFWETSGLIADNYITNNHSYGIYGQGGGICCDSRTVITITRNTIMGNRCTWYGAGIEIVSSSPTVHRNVITNNTSDGWYGGGIFAATGSLPVIDSCTISNNQGNGLYCTDRAAPVINYCNICDNAGYAIVNMDSLFIDAEYNWWGDSTGAYHPRLNPFGRGDTVSDYVDFLPWLRWPVVRLEEQGLVGLIRHCHNITVQTIVKGSMLTFTVDQPCKLNLQVYDITGREQWAAESKMYASGRHNLKLPRLANGIYFLRCMTENDAETHKLVVTR